MNEKTESEMKANRTWAPAQRRYDLCFLMVYTLLKAVSYSVHTSARRWSVALWLIKAAFVAVHLVGFVVVPVARIHRSCRLVSLSLAYTALAVRIHRTHLLLIRLLKRGSM